MDNPEEFQDSTSNLTNTETELNSTQQGFIKAITKLVRSIERANHYIQLLNTALEKKTPPRGLIPKNQSKDSRCTRKIHYQMGRNPTTDRHTAYRNPKRLLDRQIKETE